MSNEQRAITCYINKDLYRLYYSVANLSSVSRNAIFAGEIFARGLKVLFDEITAEDESTLSARTRLQLIEINTREKMYDQEILNSVVSRGIDEQISDSLQSIIADLDLDESAAVEFAQESPFAEAVAYINNGTHTGRCHRWLATVFTERETMPRPLVMAMADREGFNERLVNRASRKLGIVKQKKLGGVWHWSAPSNNTTTNTTTQL